MHFFAMPPVSDAARHSGHCWQVRDIKASAATGNQATVKQLALSLVRLRAQMGKLSASEAHLRGVRTNLSVRRLPAAATVHTSTAVQCMLNCTTRQTRC